MATFDSPAIKNRELKLHLRLCSLLEPELSRLMRFLERAHFFCQGLLRDSAMHTLLLKLFFQEPGTDTVCHLVCTVPEKCSQVNCPVYFCLLFLFVLNSLVGFLCLVINTVCEHKRTTEQLQCWEFSDVTALEIFWEWTSSLS